MHHLFFISSPFQAESALNAIEFFKIDPKDITILLFDRAWKDDAERVKHSLDWLYEHAKVSKVDVKTNSLPRRFKFIFRHAPTDEFMVYVGDWRNKLPKYFGLHPKFKGFYALDDGLASFVIAEDTCQKSAFSLSRFQPHFLSRYPLQRFNTKLSATQLPVTPSQIIYDDSILFIGCSLVENKILSSSQYFNYLSEVAETFKGHTILYYPHRAEEDKALPSSFQKINNDLPIESWYQSLEKAPNRLISFYSSALFNLKSNYPETQALFIRLHKANVGNRAKDIEFVYNVFDTLDEFNEFIPQPSSLACCKATRDGRK